MHVHCFPYDWFWAVSFLRDGPFLLARHLWRILGDLAAFRVLDDKVIIRTEKMRQIAKTRKITFRKNFLQNFYIFFWRFKK